MAQEFSTLGYFIYYMRHTQLVVLAWKDIQDLLIDNEVINEEEFNKINRLILWHDNSKIDKEEFDAYAAKYYPIEPKIDPAELEDVKMAFKVAWEIHKLKNPHHHQTLKDYKGEDWKCYLIEMICDWIAMGWETGVSAFEYYDKNEDQIELPDEYRIMLEYILGLIKTSQCYAAGELSHEKESELVFR